MPATFIPSISRQGIAGLVLALAASAGVLAGALTADPALGGLAWCGALIIIATIDLLIQRIPNALTFPLALAALALAPFGPGLPAAAAGGLAAGGLALAGWWLGNRNGKHGIGFGDVKLAGLIGIVLGPAPALQALLIAALAGGVIALTLLARGRNRAERFAYGPALTLGAVVMLAIAGAR